MVQDFVHQQYVAGCDLYLFSCVFVWVFAEGKHIGNTQKKGACTKKQNHVIVALWRKANQFK